ncbi:hypothetical protein DPEC_G00155520 [Dallia pectoralis]|uniref:Uncharacterized protein n=1 Tax=Dallia pectoralis TaxID=75939 RepID=A0ACC2GK40_DALPE|nr:hypothetical protein DPEC_G00155520 [Dallia pectoralis]
MSKPGSDKSLSSTTLDEMSNCYSTTGTNMDLLNPMDPRVDSKDQSDKANEKDQMVVLNEKDQMVGLNEKDQMVGLNEKDQMVGLNKVDQIVGLKEKDQMVGLNDKFVAFIDKVQNLELKNNELETRVKILKQQVIYKGNVDETIQQQLEEEGKKKTDVENEFVINKKDVDDGHLAAVDLALELEELMGELDFLRQGYSEELKELQSQIQNETVTVREPNNRALNVDEIIESAKNQYEEMTTRAREDAERWNQKKIDEMVQTTGRWEQDAREVKKDMADMLRVTQRLRAELEGLNKQKTNLEKDIEDSDVGGQKELEQARKNIVVLEEALRRAKQDMTRQVRDYQELMNLKLALDIEIATYRKLLEGEEMRMNDYLRQQNY